MELNFSQLTSLLIISILEIILILIIIRAHQKKADISLLISAFIFLSIGQMLFMSTNLYLISLSTILMNLGFIIFFLHYENIANEKPNEIILFTLIIIFVINVIANIMFLWLNTSSILISEFNWNNIQGTFSNWNILMYLIFFIWKIDIYFIGIIVFLRSIYILRKVYQLAKLKATFFELIALYSLLVNNISNIAYIFTSNQNIKMILSFITIIGLFFGLIVILFTYLRNPDYLYYLPFPIHSIMVYNKSGLMVYSRKVQQKILGMDEKDFLISGAFTAISALINETLGSQAKIRHINAQQFQIYFNPFPDELGSFVVIAYGATALFEKSLKRFISLLSNSFFERLNETNLNLVPLEKEIDELIKKTFPYVIIETAEIIV